MPELPHRTIMPAKRRDPGSAKPLIAPPAENRDIAIRDIDNDASLPA
jgi:hypothetical protein